MMVIQQQTWRALRGKAYGLTMPTLVGIIKVQTTIPDKLHVVNTFIATAADLNTNLPEIVDKTQKIQAESVVNIVLFWLDKIQQKARLPLFSSGLIIDSYIENGTITVFQVALPYSRARASIDALGWLIKTINAVFSAQHDEEVESQLEQAIKSCKRLITKLQHASPSGSNTLRFLTAANKLGIPWSKVTDNVFDYGYGAHLRWLDSSFSDQTSVIGARFARNKQNTATVLRQAGLPSPEHFLVNNAESAIKLAERLKYPVVIKPMDKDRGLGVAAGLKTEDEVRDAFNNARKISKKILVEKHIEGQDYRLTVLNGKLIWAVLRMPGGVVGNGKDTISVLLEKLNEDPLRQHHAYSLLKTLTLNEEALDMLSKADLTVNDIPKQGQFICLRRTANISTGGTPTAVMNNVHPDNKRLAENAAAALKLDLAGIDLIIPDISQSWLHSYAAICEVNAQPRLASITNAQIYDEILSTLVTNKGQIPIVLIIGEKSAHKVATELLPMWPVVGEQVATVSNKGMWLNHSQISKADTMLNTSKAALSLSTIDALICVATIAEVEQSGVAFDYCDVLILADNSYTASLKAQRMILAQNIKTLVMNNNEQTEIVAKTLGIKEIRAINNTDSDSLIKSLSLVAADALDILVKK
jgi:cyanophycin synthetase